MNNLKMNMSDDEFNEAEDLELLKKESKSWSVAGWEKYLKTLEVAEREGMVSLNDEMDFSDAQSFAEMICTSSIIDEFPLIYEKFGFLLEKLYSREKQVLTMIYWENKKLINIAKELGIGRSTVGDTHKRALKRLESMFQEEMKKRSKLIVLEKSFQPNNTRTHTNKTKTTRTNPL